MAACHKSRFWFGIWNECERPSSGPIYETMLFTKRKLSKALTKHKTTVIDSLSERLKDNPNEIRKFLNKKKAASDPSLPVLPSEKQWTDYFTSEFSPPDPLLEDSFSVQVDEALCGNFRDLGFTVAASNIRDCIRKLKKKQSIDELCGLHLLLC